MKKAFCLLVALLGINSAFAQSHALAAWTGLNSSTATFPVTGFSPAAEVSSATRNYGNGLIPYNDNRDVWQSVNTSPTVIPSTAPYLSFNLTAVTSIQYDRFIYRGLASQPSPFGVKSQLRWSVDNFATALGDFSPTTSNYALTSVDLSGTAVVPAGNIEFRVYYYGSAGYCFHVWGTYPSLDGTPPTYTPLSGTVNIDIWGDQAVAPPPTTVPTLSEWGLILMALFLVCIGAIAVWRQRYATRVA
jgi:hypothetical protein